MSDTRCLKHRHWFSPFAMHFGRFGDQGVHYHPCIEGDGCARVVMGEGRQCDPAARHWRETLTAASPDNPETGDTT